MIEPREATTTPTSTPLPAVAASVTVAPTSPPAATPTTDAPPPPAGNSAVPINYFDNNPDWEALVACAANLGGEIAVSPDKFRNVAGPFERYENGLVYFQGYDEALHLNTSSTAGIRYVTQGDPLFRFEPAFFGQLPWTAGAVIGALQPGYWIIVGGGSGYLGVACNAFQP